MTFDLSTTSLVKSFLQNQFSVANTSDSIYGLFRYKDNLNKAEHIARLKAFSEWFRMQFPYYYDNCNYCKHSRNNTYLGMSAPTSYEKLHVASRTEFYLCSLCNQVTRFPRYQVITKVRLLSHLCGVESTH